MTRKTFHNSLLSVVAASVAVLAIMSLLIASALKLG
jgi:hypothetical protein